MTENMSYTVNLEEDNSGNLVIPLSPACYKELDLQEGDMVKYTPRDDGSVVVTKWDRQLDLFYNVDDYLGEVITYEKELKNG